MGGGTLPIQELIPASGWKRVKCLFYFIFYIFLLRPRNNSMAPKQKHCLTVPGNWDSGLSIAQLSEPPATLEMVTVLLTLTGLP